MHEICLDCELALVCTAGGLSIIFRCPACKRVEVEVSVRSHLHDYKNIENAIYRYVSDRCPKIYKVISNTRCEECRNENKFK